MSLIRSTMAALALSLLIVPQMGCNPCDDDGELVICGDFGELVYTAALPAMGPEVRWPAVVTDDSTLIVSTDWEVNEISGSGVISTLHSNWARRSAPSLTNDGTLFVVDDAVAMALSVDPGRGGDDGVEWSTSLRGEAGTTPPAIDDGRVHVSLSSNNGEDRSLVTLELETGSVARTREDTSPAAVSADGSLRYLTGASDCGARFDEMVAEEPDGEVRWRHVEPTGIRDFAPGPDGEVYFVNGDRALSRMSKDGEVEWSFVPDCAECNVAAAPTVTEDKVYFPVWQGWAPNQGCDEEEPEFSDTLDPLYALSRSGELLWTYDGFDTMANRPSEMDALGGVLFMSTAQVTRHHPAGRPTVAEDGTLYVSTDGAVVALDENGKQLGYAMFQPAAGEVRSGDGGALFTSLTINSGVSRAPVLGPQGDLYMYDGVVVRSFRTDKKAATIPWSAPFGGHRNAGKVGG